MTTFPSALLALPTWEIRVDAQLDPIIVGPPVPLVLLSQGETRPGVKQGQHWGRSLWSSAIGLDPYRSRPEWIDTVEL